MREIIHLRKPDSGQRFSTWVVFAVKKETSTLCCVPNVFGTGISDPRLLTRLVTHVFGTGVSDPRLLTRSVPNVFGTGVSQDPAEISVC